MRSTEDATTASAAKKAAWRSRGTIWVEIGSTFSPSFSATCASTLGAMLAKVRTAPERAQGAISARAADGLGQLRLDRPALQCRDERLGIRDENVGGSFELHRKASVEHVRAREPHVDKARLGADEFREVGQERDHVVLRLALDLVDALDVEFRVCPLLPDRLRRLPRDRADLG